MIKALGSGRYRKIEQKKEENLYQVKSGAEGFDLRCSRKLMLEVGISTDGEILD